MSYQVKNRLKSSLDKKQLKDRLQYKPEIMELHLVDKDLFGQNRISLVNKIKMLKRQNIKVYLHHPMRFENIPLDIIIDTPHS